MLNVKGLGANRVVRIHFDQSTIRFSAGSTGYTLNVPNADVTFSPTATVATTSFDSTSNTWRTTTPSSGVAGNAFLDGFGLSLPAGLPGGINPVVWQGRISSDTPGVTVNWQWAAAVYTSFSTDYNTLGVKPVDDNKASAFQNSDHAGTPERFKAFVIGGARGGGGANYTGSYSGTTSAACP